MIDILIIQNEDELQQITKLQLELEELKEQAIRRRYVEVDIVNADGDVSKDIISKLDDINIKVDCHWEGESHYRGTNILYVYGKYWDIYNNEIIDRVSALDIDHAPEIKDFRKK